ncbi:hypothetical protein [Nannocystis punicea]|uniref:Uncharacterized protein n=1 Tax=Nannocystis punicea TaxID=2995304 RepID=A0ABY7GSC7_9BACT|nr:hypothetical protein [Nannocystis poenicansa]WAS89839.1 hypothetical protein O0S08_26910 [Nannocystis poenicansa]
MPDPSSTSEPPVAPPGTASGPELEASATTGEASPAHEATPAGLIAPWPTGACDPSGTWRVKLHPQRPFCAPVPPETFDIAIGFVRKGDRTVLAAVGEPVGEPGKIGGRMRSMHVSLLAGPYVGCEVRLHSTLGRADWATHTELKFRVFEHKLEGGGAQWNAPALCNEVFALSGERTAAGPAEWAQLGEPAPPQVPAPPRPADEALAAAVAGISAESLLGPAVSTITTLGLYDEIEERAARIALRGSIVEYVTAAVGQARDISLHEVPCSLPDAGRCVAVVGDPCRPEFLDPQEDWDCEGLYLVVVVDVDRKRLDRANTAGYPVRSHADIAGWELIAP